jgi:hypothetical protein
MQTPSIRDKVAVGSVLTYSRSYSPAELAAFDELSGRNGAAEDGYLPDLLVIAPLTKLGGDLDHVSRQMEWQVHRQVRVTETIQAELEVTALEPRNSIFKIAFDARIRTSDGDVVLSGHSYGVIPRTDLAPTSA